MRLSPSETPAISGIQNLTYEQLEADLARGARIVSYEYCVSILILTFRGDSGTHYIPPGQSAVVRGLPYTVLSLVAGWWGIPWGPIRTIGALATNLRGGKDVTYFLGPQLLKAMRPPPDIEPQPIVCPKCGVVNAPGRFRCAECRAQLSAPPG